MAIETFAFDNNIFQSVCNVTITLSSCRGTRKLALRRVNLKCAPAANLSERLIVSSKKRCDRMIPREFALHAHATELAHSSPLFWMIDQPKNLAGEISHLILRVAIERGFLSANPAFLKIKLNDRFAQGHIFHDLNHRRNIVHAAGFVRVDTDISSGKDLQKILIRYPSREIHHISEILLAVNLHKFWKVWSRTDST